MVRRLVRAVVVVAVVVLALASFVACSSDRRAELTRAAAAADDAGASALADQLAIVAGVVDRGRDPGVVGVGVGGPGLCSGALISPRLVLTARHCVSRTPSRVACPRPPDEVQILSDRTPDELAIFVGEDVASSRRVAGAIAVVAPAGMTLCDADVAVIVLDQEVTVVKPLPVGTRGPAVGDRIRAVGFAKPTNDDPAGPKLVREHVAVVSVSAGEFNVGEATCQGDSGGPALDEETGEVLGVVSRAGPSCDGPDVHNVYTRLDAYAWLTEQAFAKAAETNGEDDGDWDASAWKPVKRGAKAKPPSDIGSGCARGADCAAGVCITSDSGGAPSRYCSRGCGSGDRCPAHYHCEPVSAAADGDAGDAATAATAATACVSVD